MSIDYSLSRVDPDGVIWEPTFERKWYVEIKRKDFILDFTVIYTGIYKTFPKDWPNHAQAGVKIWYKLTP